VPAKHLILGLLARGEIHGYPIREVLQRVFGRDWQMPSARIYALLGELGREGLVSVERTVSASGSRRRSYRISSAGRLEYRRWLMQPGSAHGLLHRELLAKLAIALELGPEVLRDIVRRERAARLRTKMLLHRRLVELEAHRRERGASCPDAVAGGDAVSPALAVSAREAALCRMAERLACGRQLTHLEIELRLLDAIDARVATVSAGQARPAMRTRAPSLR